ncbi:MAG: hypothetical protein JNK47_12595 [Mesorhizobium sp.]|nr:hypothetical protein [Mesorhizobium sp.]MBL8578060.1 hypothetical protein [Mesorhizobium sp.]
MSEQTLHLNFRGAGLVISASDRAWVDAIAAAYASFVDEGQPSPGAFRLSIVDTDALPPDPHMPLTWEGLNNSGVPCRIFESETEQFFVADEKVVKVETHASGVATVFALPESRKAFLSSILIPVIESTLFHGGQYLLHAACLVEDASGRSVLVCAPSGYGKTTTAMTLAHDGFSLMTDDVAVVVPKPEGVQAWGVPRALKVHRRTAELLSWIGPLPDDRWDENGEQGIALEKIADRIGVMTPEARPLAAIIVLGSRSPAGHVLKPASRPEVLAVLAHDNVAGRAAGITTKALDRFMTFADMIQRTPAFTLHAGENLASLPGIVSGALGGKSGFEP